MMFGTSWMRAKQNLWEKYSDNLFKIKFFYQMPLQHTIRPFTEAEKELSETKHLLGVRTYYFGAHHYRGFPQFSPAMSNRTNHNDCAWIPKR